MHNHDGGVVVSLLASSVVDRGFEPLSDQTKDYEIGICQKVCVYVSFMDFIYYDYVVLLQVLIF
jgi:hypothetical protein